MLSLDQLLGTFFFLMANTELTLWAVYNQDKAFVIPKSNEDKALLGGSPISKTLAERTISSISVTLSARE
jgi:hypothetical protein